MIHLPTEQCQEHYARVVERASAIGALTELNRSVDWLDTYACDDGTHIDRNRTRCVLYPDFAPLSFTFAMERRQDDGTYKFWFNGGLIYSGPEQVLDGSFPALTVSLGRTGDKPRWSVHT